MSFENVVLTYQHPHVAVFVEDNTVYTEDTFLAPDHPVKMLQCGVFGQGRDNQLIYCKNKAEFISEFGSPNYKLYGQAAYNIHRALDAGDCGAYVLRVMPEDATYANTMIMIKYKVVEAEDGTKALSVGYTAQTLENAITLSKITKKLRQLDDAEPDEDGYYTRPLLTVYSLGRGKFGNNLRFRIADITNYDDDTAEYKDYRFDVLTMEEKLVRKEYAMGCLNQDAFEDYLQESLFLQDLINDPDNGLGKVNIIFNSNLYEELVDIYNTQVIGDEDTPATIDTFDIIYGRTMDGEINPLIKIETSEDSVSFTAESDGVILASGSDGALDFASETRDEEIENLLISAYSGELDKAILSTYSTRADFMLDANYPEAVKRAMAALAMRRQYDCTCYLDCGLADTTTECLRLAYALRDIKDPNVIKEAHHYTYRDREFTGKSIDMTSTFFLAGLIPNHFNKIGLGVPMAMVNARLTEAVPGSFLPVLDPDDHEIKKEFYKLRLNYYESIRRNVFQRGVAVNSQELLSDRMDEFNNYILNLAVQTARSIMHGHIYNFAEAEDRERYQKQTNDVMDQTLGRFVRSCEVSYVMSKNDERKNILRLRLRIVFKTVVKRGIVEVYLDPRVSDS